MNWKQSCCLISTLACSSIYALVEQPINEKKTIPISFSTSSHNRISIEKGSVEKIFGDETCFNISIDRTTGNAFVNLIKELQEPMTLTVVTSSGLIQDLSVTSSEIPSEHLILKEVEDDIDELMNTTSDFHGLTIDFLNKILEGKIPLGYGQRPLQAHEHITLPHPISATTVEAFEGPFENIIVYKIKNTGKDSVIMNADSIKKDKALWVFLNAHELKAKEELLCIISYPKNEE